MRPKVVIVGGGFGGLSAAKRLARDDVHVVLIDQKNHHLFQPLLYQVATAALSPADIAVPIRSVLKAGKRQNLEVLMDEVRGIDLGARKVLTRDGAEQQFDFLILATGASYFYFGNGEWPEFAPALKTLDDAISIRHRILLAFEKAESASDPAQTRRHLTTVVIGGGPTGVEMAGALAELARATMAADFDHIDPRQARVVLIEAGPRLLGAFPEELGHYAGEELRRLGVEVRTNTSVSQITASGVAVGEETVPSATVIWCAGVRATPAGAWLGAATASNGAILVEEDLSVKGHPNVFAVGDVASFSPPGQEPLPGLAPVAKQMGRHAAEVISARVSGREVPAPFRYRDWGTMATIGRSAAVGQFGRLKVTGWFAWLLWGLVHIMYLIGFRNRFFVAANWLWSWATYAKGARLITGTGSVEAASLERDAGRQTSEPTTLPSGPARQAASQD